ncbi:IS3 family transposase [Micrococcus sp. EYE_212]|nr:IS3 family transposase [Micrococcus sp. EYE_212]
MDYIDEHKHDIGVEPICATLSAAGTQIAPSTYFAAKTRPPSARSLSDARLLVQIRRVHEANDGVYGARKVHAQLRREGLQVARCTVARLMRAAGLRGISRAKGPRTTVPGRGPDSREDLVQRDFTAAAPNQLWVVRHHLLPHLHGMGVRRVHHRRVLPPGAGVAAVDVAAHGPGPGRVGDGVLDASACRPRRGRATASQR